MGLDPLFLTYILQNMFCFTDVNLVLLVLVHNMLGYMSELCKSLECKPLEALDRCHEGVLRLQLVAGSYHDPTFWIGLATLVGSALGIGYLAHLYLKEKNR